MDIVNRETITSYIKTQARALGFLDVGIARAEHMDEEARRLENWLNQNYHGEMDYMEDHFDLRVDPTKLLPSTKSVISLTYNYYTDEKQEDPSAPKVSMYAYGRDYHKVIKKKLHKLIDIMKERVGSIEAKAFVDSGPILERDWARRSSLGWIGKHTLLISKQKGSYFFLCEILCDLELEYDLPLQKEYCGTCTRCIDACPTDAIAKDGFSMDGSKCISYLTIEKEGEIPKEFKDKMEGWVYGCDICQQVCPWNRFSKPHTELRFLPTPELMRMKKKDWEELSMETYDAIFYGSPLKRAQYEGIMRNVAFLSGNQSVD